MAALVDAIKTKLHLKKKEDGSSSSSSEDELKEHLAAILSSDFGADFKCAAAADCAHGDVHSTPQGKTQRRAGARRKWRRNV